MNANINFGEKAKHVERLLHKEEYTDSATRCVLVIEQAFRYILRQYSDQINETARRNIQEALQKRDSSGRGIERLTMGQLLHVVREAKFLDVYKSK